MRTSILAGLAALGVASVAHADDTKPPQISDVKAAAKGGQVQVEARITDETGVLSAVCYHRAPGEKAQASPMTKSDLDDTFRVTFAGGGERILDRGQRPARKRPGDLGLLEQGLRRRR